jgi:hypothetical protein
MSQAKRELEALWQAVFHEPPVIDADPHLLAELIVRCSQPPPPYGDAIPARPPNLNPPDDTSAPCDR